MTSNKSLITFLTLRLTKNKKMSIICFISILLFIYTSTQYTSNSIIINSSSISSFYNTRTKSSSQSPLIKQEEQQEERYLAYLPHSGLSNQRIELANGLLLAHMLNRTLLIPPAFLGTVFGWMPRTQLLSRLEWLTTPKDFNKLCQRPTPGRLASYVQRSRCEEYRHFGVINWAELHDFQPLVDMGIRIKFQPILSLSQITKDLNITRDDQMYLHDDMQLYDWRLYENKTEAVELLRSKMNYFDSFSGRRYHEVLLPHHFQQKQEKLLFLGGIFGSTRFKLISPEYIQMKDEIKRLLHYRLDTPLGKTVKSIVNYLGGKGTFMSLHFRTGDKPFKKEISPNLEKFIENMTDIMGYNQQESSMDNACLNIHQPPPQTQFMDENETSILVSYGNRVKVYIATDYLNPKSEKSQLLPWFDQFPCTSTLGDVPDHLLRPLDELRDITSPHKSLRNFFIPLVDAMVAAHARKILTTPRSTFSSYIQELHQAWLL